LRFVACLYRFYGSFLCRPDRLRQQNAHFLFNDGFKIFSADALQLCYGIVKTAHGLLVCFHLNAHAYSGGVSASAMHCSMVMADSCSSAFH